MMNSSNCFFSTVHLISPLDYNYHKPIVCIAFTSMSMNDLALALMVLECFGIDGQLSIKYTLSILRCYCEFEFISNTFKFS